VSLDELKKRCVALDKESVQRSVEYQRFDFVDEYSRLNLFCLHANQLSVVSARLPHSSKSWQICT